MTITDLRGEVPDNDYVPAGIGGWLLLPVLHLLVNIGTIGYSIVPFVTGFVHGFITAWNHDGRHTPPPHHNAIDQSLVLYSCLQVLFCVCIILLAVICLIRLFQMKRYLPKLMIVFYATLLILAVSNVVLLKAYPGFSGLMDSNAYQQKVDSSIFGLIRTIVFVSIWIPYFNVSKRVKKTFVN